MNFLSDQQISNLAAMVRKKFGLEYPPDRFDDLRRVVTGFAAEVSPQKSLESCVERFLKNGLTPKEQEALVGHLTIGETYLFREPKTLKIIEQKILKPLSGKGSGLNGAIRIWSAACSTGEEPYTLAIMGDQLGIDLEIIGTDIDSRAIMSARKAVYRKWSFRNEQALSIQNKYFDKVGDNAFHLKSEISSRVNFKKLNLVDRVFPASIDSFDLILCRNVLMYFASKSVSTVLDRIKNSMSENGWFISTASESYLVVESGKFLGENVDDVLFFKKLNGRDADSRGSYKDRSHLDLTRKEYDSSRNTATLFSSSAGEDYKVEPSLRFSRSASVRDKSKNDFFLAEKFSYTEKSSETKVAPVYTSFSSSKDVLDSDDVKEITAVEDVQELLNKGRSLLDSGDIVATKKLCKFILKFDHVNSEAYYLLGEANLKDNNPIESIRSFRKALYVDPGVIMADVMLGNIHMDSGDFRSAAVHFRSALRSMSGKNKDDLVEHSGDLTAGRLAEMIEKLASVCADRHGRIRF